MNDQTHMRREIAEIPDAAARLLDRGGQALAAAGRGIRDLNPLFVISVARGSSDHAASFLKYAVELTAGIPVASVGPSVASIYGANLRLSGSLCLSISQSGKSPDIVAMVAQAKAGGALTVALTNTPHSPLAAASDYPINISGRTGTQRGGNKDLRQFLRRRPCLDGALHGRCRTARRARPFAGAIPRGDRLRLDGDCRGAGERAFPVHSRARPVLRDRQRGGAEVQGDMRHACRGLQRSRGDARPAGTGRSRFPGAGARRARCLGGFRRRNVATRSRPRARASSRHRGGPRRRACCRISRPAIR